MLSDIAPHKFVNAYSLDKPTPDDYALCYTRNDILLTGAEGEPRAIPTFEQLPGDLLEKGEYAFELDGIRFFLVREKFELELPPAGTSFVPLSQLSTFLPRHVSFTCHTGAHLYRFKRDRAFCGRCGKPMSNSEVERAVVCECGAVEYPKIAPAIIVAITDEKDRLVCIRGRNFKGTGYGLVAGFVEFGETFEEAVQREVMEEVGIRIKNVTYYKSQPWPFPDSIMIGFFAELDGDDTLHIQESELSEAVWIPREQLPDTPTSTSISQELREAVKAGIHRPYLELHKQRPHWDAPVPEPHWQE
ncbi:MAG: NAD(+) diphosphatase [Clostridia bacterium]|nr:NAD(+) diphosphatase [Clostridia bacterium]